MPKPEWSVQFCTCQRDSSRELSSHKVTYLRQRGTSVDAPPLAWAVDGSVHRGDSGRVVVPCLTVIQHVPRHASRHVVHASRVVATAATTQPVILIKGSRA